jgi:hypothetical protein
LYGAVVASAVGLAALGYPFGVAALASFGIELSLSFAPGWLVESLRMPRSAAILLGMVGFSSGFERLIGALGMVGFLFHYGCSIGAFTPPPPPSYPLPPLTAFPDWRDDLLSHDGEEKNGLREHPDRAETEAKGASCASSTSHKTKHLSTVTGKT